jgi:hypothetical protein
MTISFISSRFLTWKLASRTDRTQALHERRAPRVPRRAVYLGQERRGVVHDGERDGDARDRLRLPHDVPVALRHGRRRAQVPALRGDDPALAARRAALRDCRDRRPDVDDPDRDPAAADWHIHRSQHALEPVGGSTYDE